MDEEAVGTGPDEDVADVDLATLRQPAVLAAFRGWNDAGEAASSVVMHLLERHDGQTLSRLDDGYYDLRENRPLVFRRGGVRQLQWPHTSVLLCRTAQRDLLLVLGDEPNLAWQRFCEQLLAVVDRAGATPVVVLGAMNSDEPHTRPLPVAIDATNPELVWGLGAEESDYSGPTGITGVLSQLAVEAGHQVVSMWVSAPYYGPDGECPKATLALARRVSEVLAVDFDFGALEQKAADWEALVDELIEQDADLVEFVRTLERSRDEGLEPTSGEDLAAQIEQYLRDTEQ